jgi:hypothetical protein
MREDVLSAIAAASRNAVDAGPGMRPSAHACVAYIAGRLISGRKILSLYDYAQSCDIDISNLPRAEELSSFDYISWSHMAKSSGISKFKYNLGAGNHIDISIKGNTFIVYMTEETAHFMGTVRGDTVYIYDHKSSAHFNFRMMGYAVES